MGVTSRHTLNRTRGRTTTFTTSHITCSRQGAKLKELTSSRNSCTLSRTRIGHRVVRRPPPPQRLNVVTRRFSEPRSCDISTSRYLHMHAAVNRSQCVFPPNYSIINITEMTLSRMTAVRRHLSAQLCKFCPLGLTGWSVAKHHRDLIFCRKQPGVGAYIVSIVHFS